MTKTKMTVCDKCGHMSEPDFSYDEKDVARAYKTLGEKPPKYKMKNCNQCYEEKNYYECPHKLLPEPEDLVKRLIKLIEKDYTLDKCKGYYPDCGNCQGQVLLGHLEAYLDLLKYGK